MWITGYCCGRQFARAERNVSTGAVRQHAGQGGLAWHCPPERNCGLGPQSSLIGLHDPALFVCLGLCHRYPWPYQMPICSFAPADETPHNLARNRTRHSSRTKAPSLVAEMDPLSITTAVLTIITAAEQTRRALDRVRTVLKAMPGRLSALNNQVADLEVLLHQIVRLMESHDQHPELARPEAHSQIQDVVHRAGALLQELRHLSAQIEKAGDGQSRIGSIQRARAWQRYLPRLHEIQDDLTGVKSTLNLLLGASNSSAAFPLQSPNCAELCPNFGCLPVTT